LFGKPAAAALWRRRRGGRNRLEILSHQILAVLNQVMNAAEPTNLQWLGVVVVMTINVNASANLARLFR
jgi:hypothetical protein